MLHFAGVNAQNRQNRGESRESPTTKRPLRNRATLRRCKMRFKTQLSSPSSPIDPPPRDPSDEISDTLPRGSVAPIRFRRRKWTRKVTRNAPRPFASSRDACVALRRPRSTSANILFRGPTQLANILMRNERACRQFPRESISALITP